MALWKKLVLTTLGLWVAEAKPLSPTEALYKTGDIPLEWRSYIIPDIRRMEGVWEVDPAYSDPMDPILSQLGFGWVKRRMLRNYRTLTRIDLSEVDLSNTQCFPKSKPRSNAMDLEETGVPAPLDEDMDVHYDVEILSSHHEPDLQLNETSWVEDASFGEEEEALFSESTEIAEEAEAVYYRELRRQQHMSRQVVAISSDYVRRLPSTSSSLFSQKLVEIFLNTTASSEDDVTPFAGSDAHDQDVEGASVLSLMMPEFISCLKRGEDINNCSHQADSVGLSRLNMKDCGTLKMTTYFPYNNMKVGAIKVGGVFEQQDSDTGLWTSTADYIQGRLVQKRTSAKYGVMYDVRAVLKKDPRDLIRNTTPVFLFRWTLVPNGSQQAIIVNRWSRHMSDS